MRIGDVSEGATHLSINLRKQYPSSFIALSMTRHRDSTTL